MFNGTALLQKRAPRSRGIQVQEGGRGERATLTTS